MGVSKPLSCHEYHPLEDAFTIIRIMLILPRLDVIIHLQDTAEPHHRQERVGILDGADHGLLVQNIIKHYFLRHEAILKQAGVFVHGNLFSS